MQELRNLGRSAAVVRQSWLSLVGEPAAAWGRSSTTPSGNSDVHRRALPLGTAPSSRQLRLAERRGRG